VDTFAVRAAIARRLPGRPRPWPRRLLGEYWQAVETVTVDDVLVGDAGHAADTYGLRAPDALHLAAAERIRSRDLVFATWDAELGRAARRAGFATIPGAG
jgi:predicted nucleic acid-binding protein